MTAPLSSLIANAIGNKSVEISTAQTNPKQTQPLSNAALANATALANSAKVTIARLPDQILSITSQPFNTASINTVPQAINVQVPMDVYQQPLQHARIALLTNAQLPTAQVSSDGAVLLSTASQAQSSMNISRSDLEALMKAIEQAVLKNTALVSMRGRVSQRPDGQLALTSSQGIVLNLPELNNTTAQTLRKLTGQRVTLSLINNTASLSIQADKSAALLQVPIDGKPAENNRFKSDIIHGALTQGTVAVDLKNTAALERLLPKRIGQEQNVLQSTALLSLLPSTTNKNQLSNLLYIHVAQRKALLTFTSAHLSGAPPLLSKSDIAKLSLNSIPQGKPLSSSNTLFATSTNDGHSALENISISDRSADPKALKGSDVHQAITTLSRVLLSQTGSTKDALSQLLSTVQGRESNALPANAVLKAVQQIAGLDPLTAKSAAPLGSKTPTMMSAQITDKVSQANIQASIDNTGGLTSLNASTGSQTKTLSGNTYLIQDISEQSLPERIQQVLSTATLVTTPTTLTTPVNQSGFVQGLVTLLQLALAGRALQRQPNLKSFIDMPDSVIAKTLNNVGVSTTPSKVSQDVNQLDTRQQLVSQLKTLLTGHQHTKLNNAEARIQGQDAFYYVLPALSQTQAPAELLIQREKERQNKQEESQNQRSLWNVTMKLDIGDKGQVLAKSKINKDTITLNLYASNDESLQRLANTLPYLTKRLSSLGLEVTEASYQRGKMPETLNTRPHQIFETRV